ncbi:MAG: EthD family reductase [Blastomonas sp.]
MAEIFTSLPRRDILKFGTGGALATMAGGTLPLSPLLAASTETSEPADMLHKSISFIRRKPGLTLEEFHQHWLGSHGPGARQIPGIEGFVLGEIAVDPGAAQSSATGAVQLDGIAESWQAPGIRRAEQAKTNPHVREWLAAAPNYIGALNIYVTREHVFVPPKRGGKKVMTLLYPKEGQSREDFVRHVLEVHGPLSRNVPGLRGYVLSEIIRAPAMPGMPQIEELGEVGIIGQSWMSPDPDEQTPDSEGRRAWLADGKANFGSFKRFVMTEHEFVPPPYDTPA